MKLQILTYLKESYQKTGWPFIAIVEVTNSFGPGSKDCLNELSREGLIRKRIGINSDLAELLEKH